MSRARLVALDIDGTLIPPARYGDGRILPSVRIRDAVTRLLGPRLIPRPVITIFDNVHPDDLPRTRELFERLVADPSVGTTCEIELRKRHEDGRWRWLQFTATNLLNDRAVRGIVLNGRDITDRKLLEERLTQHQHGDYVATLDGRPEVTASSATFEGLSTAIEAAMAGQGSADAQHLQACVTWNRTLTTWGYVQPSHLNDGVRATIGPTFIYL